MPLRSTLVAICLATSGWLPAAHAAEKLEIEFLGVEGALLENVQALSSLQRLSRSEELDADMIARLAQRAPDEARTALRPYGYYAPEVSTELAKEEDVWHARVTIEPGEPVLLVDQQVEITGSGSEEPFLRQVLDPDVNWVPHEEADREHHREGQEPGCQRHPADQRVDLAGHRVRGLHLADAARLARLRRVDLAALAPQCHGTRIRGRCRSPARQGQALRRSLTAVAAPRGVGRAAGI
jgi:hypothetical protein